MSKEIKYDETKGVKCDCGKILKIPALVGLPVEWKTYLFRCVCGRKYIPQYMGDIIWDLSDLTKGKTLVFEPNEPTGEFNNIEEHEAEEK